MPTLLITSWQSHFFWFPVSSVCCPSRKSSIICTNLDDSRTRHTPTVVSTDTPRCQWWFHAHSVFALCTVWHMGRQGFHSRSPSAWRPSASDTGCPLRIAPWLAGSSIASQPIRRAGVSNYPSSLQPNVPIFLRGRLQNAKPVSFMWSDSKECVVFSANNENTQLFRSRGGCY